MDILSSYTVVWRVPLPHLIRPGQRWNKVKFKTWYLLGLREEKGIFEPISVGAWAYWTGVNVASLRVLVITWRSPSWRRILRRRLPDGTYGYILGSKGRRWLAECPRFIPEATRNQWLDEIVDHQQAMLAEQERWQARRNFYNEHGYWPD